MYGGAWVGLVLKINYNQGVILGMSVAYNNFTITKYNINNGHIESSGTI